MTMQNLGQNHGRKIEKLYLGYVGSYSNTKESKQCMKEGRMFILSGLDSWHDQFPWLVSCGFYLKCCLCKPDGDFCLSSILSVKVKMLTCFSQCGSSSGFLPQQSAGPSAESSSGLWWAVPRHFVTSHDYLEVRDYLHGPVWLILLPESGCWMVQR